MKVIINYDFFDAIKDVNEPLHPLKIIRNRKTKYILLFPMGVAISYAAKLSQNINYDLHYWIMYFTYIYGVNIGAEMLGAYLGKIIFKRDKDYFGMASASKLKQLVGLLHELNVNTNYEMLLKSDFYYKEYEFIPNDKVLSLLIIKKYINIPSYNYNGEITETSILQEHVIGSKEYILSINKPHKQHKLSLVKNPA